MFPLSRSLSIAMALALPAIACAQQPADLDQVEVTATRTADADLGRLAGGAALTVLGGVVSGVAGFAVMALVAWVLGPAAAGVLGIGEGVDVGGVGDLPRIVAGAVASRVPSSAHPGASREQQDHGVLRTGARGAEDARATRRL